MLNANTQLNTHELAALHDLQAACKIADGYTIPIHSTILTAKRRYASNLWFEEKGQWIGFLSIYFFYDEGCELALMVRPSHRQQGIATRLLQHIIPLLVETKTNFLMISTPAKPVSSWFESRGLTHEYTEYRFSWNARTPLPMQTEMSPITFVKATPSDSAALLAINKMVFEPPFATEANFENILRNPEYTIWLAMIGQQIVGKVHLYWEHEQGTLMDLAVLPSHQKQGIGRKLVIHALQETISRKKKRICLDVDAKNIAAINLYTQLGFNIENVCDYWKLFLTFLKKQ